MARKKRPQKAPRKPPREGGRVFKKRPCHFCKEKIPYIDYKDTSVIRRYINDRYKIRPRRVTGTCGQHQRELSAAIKNAREMALIAYTDR